MGMKGRRVTVAVVSLIVSAGAAAAVLSPSAGAVGGTCTVGFTATNETSGGWARVGQSFTACLGGRVTSIDIQYTGVPVVKTLTIFDGNTISGSPVYTQPGVVLAGIGYSHIVLGANFSVAQGHQYTFSVDQGSGIGFNFDGLPGESAWFSNGSPTEFPGLSIGHLVHIAKLWKV
jgi:hypothetical protein